MPTVDVDFTHADEIFAGEDKTLTITVLDKNGAPVDISGFTFRWQVRLSRYNATALLTKQTGGQGITIAPQSGVTMGQLTVVLAAADTASMKAGTYKQGLMRTNLGAHDVQAEGDFVLRKAAVA